jgi:hypothetical protein
LHRYFWGSRFLPEGYISFFFHPILAWKMQETRPSRVLAACLVVLAAAVAVTLPVFAPHPIARLLQELDQTSAGKLRLVPKALHPQWTLPLCAFLVASVGFFVRMDLARVFLLFSAASFVLLTPFAVTFALHGERQRFAYLSVSAMAFALWAMSAYEKQVIASARLREKKRKNGLFGRSGFGEERLA